MSHLYFFIKKSGFHRFRVALTHSVRCAGGWCWSGVREKYCWLAGGCRLVLERCERKTLLSWRLVELPNTVNGGLHLI